MNSLLLLYCLAFQNTPGNVHFLIERVETLLPDGTNAVSTNKIWVGKNRVRIDRGNTNTTLLYDLDIHIVILVDHESKSYVLSRAGRNKKPTRNQVMGLIAFMQEPTKKGEPLASPLNVTDQISGWSCQAHQINYPAGYGISTVVWTTVDPIILDKSIVRKIWYAAIGTAPPNDVRIVINQVLRDLHGIPIRTQSLWELEGIEVQTTTTLTHVELQGDIDTSVLAIPSGYHMAEKN